MPYDQYDPTALGENPPRKEYRPAPGNLNTAETAKKAGASRGNIQQSDGTASPRAESKTKSAAMPGEKSGGSKIPKAVDTHEDSKEL